LSTLSEQLYDTFTELFIQNVEISK